MQDGKTLQIWNDLWEGRIMAQTCPELMSFAVNKQVTLHQVWHTPNLFDLFNLPLSTEAFVQYQQLEQQLLQLNLSDAPDCWTYIWGSTMYSSQKAYKFMIGHT